MLQLDVETWEYVAVRVLRAFLVRRGGAVVWPEVEAFLSTPSWVAEHSELWEDGVTRDFAPKVLRIDPHHLTYARRVLRETGELVEEATVLQQRRVVALVHEPSRSEARTTEINRLAARKRRAYRSFLTWTANATCGDVAERLVQATLLSLRGRHLWVHDARRGQVSTLDGDPVPGGPLDHAGHWALDPADPSAGFIGFGVEVKNVRHTLYPSHREVWDLLAKMGAFPMRVPILITRRLHYWTYQMFSEIGAIAFQSERQWFSPTIDAGRFQRVTDMLGFRDAVRVADPDAPNRALSKWLTATVRKGTRGDARPLMQRQHERWQRAAPICAEYLGLRDDLDSEARHEVFAQFVEELREEGFDTSGFAPGDD